MNFFWTTWGESVVQRSTHGVTAQGFIMLERERVALLPGVFPGDARPCYPSPPRTAGTRLRKPPTMQYGRLCRWNREDVVDNFRAGCRASFMQYCRSHQNVPQSRVTLSMVLPEPVIATFDMTRLVLSTCVPPMLRPPVVTLMFWLNVQEFVELTHLIS